MKAILKFMFFFICLSALEIVPVAAYLDPSSATYIIQIVAGIFVVGGMMIGVFWHRLKNLFKKHNKDEKPSEDTDEVDDENLAD